MANLKPFSDVELGVLGLEAQKGMKFTGEVVLRLIDTISNERGDASEAMLGMGLMVALAALRKAKAGLIYSAQNTQDYPPDVLELGTALDALDLAMGDVIDWFSGASIHQYMADD